MILAKFRLGCNVISDITCQHACITTVSPHPLSLYIFMDNGKSAGTNISISTSINIGVKICVSNLYIVLNHLEIFLVINRRDLNNFLKVPEFLFNATSHPICDHHH